MYSSFRDNIWGADLADMQSISKYNKGFRFLICVIDIFSKYAWVATLKGKKKQPFLMHFKVFSKDPNKKPNKIWVEKGSKFYNNPFKKRLQLYSYVFNT